MPKQLHEYNVSYNFCGVCGRQPNSWEESNWAPIKWWDPDDGWKIGTLCRWCFNEVKDDAPQPDDYAVTVSKNIDLDVWTDEDPLEAL